MKERFVKIIKRLDDCSFSLCYVKQIKDHWWSKWKEVMDEAAPLLFYKLPEGIKASNEIPSLKYLLTTDKIRLSSVGLIPSPYKSSKGDPKIRESMIDMVLNADEIYVGIKEDGKYYVATDTKSVESCRDLQTLEIVVDGYEE